MSRDEHEKFERELVKRYPLLYRDMYGSPQQTCMSFGIGVGKGWWPIIEDLSAKLEPKLEVLKEEVEKTPNLKCEVCWKSKRWHWFFALAATVTCFFKNLKRWPKCAKQQLKRNLEWRRADYTEYHPSIFRGVFRLPRWHRVCKRFRLPLPCAAQVKEKFGTLRYYMTFYNEDVEMEISKAEKLSSKTCESCGAPGKTRDGGWIRTLCDTCDGKSND